MGIITALRINSKETACTYKKGNNYIGDEAYGGTDQALP